MKITRTSPSLKQSNINHVCESARMHGRTRSSHWSWNAEAEVNSLRENRHDFRMPKALDRKAQGKWVNEYTPKVQPCDGVTVTPVKGNRVAWLSEEQTKRFKITITNDAGVEEQARMSMKFTTLAILTYGKVVEFVRCHRGVNVRDMRTDTLRSPAYVTAEIRRLIPVNAEQAIEQLFATE